MLLRSGERPPCIVKIFSSMMAAMGRQLKQSVKVFHSLILYLLLPVKKKKKRNIVSATIRSIVQRKRGFF